MNWVLAMREQLEKELLEIMFMMPFAKFAKRTFVQDLTAMDDRDAVAEFFDLAHDMRRKNHALAQVAQFGDRFEQGPCD
jgi:hypothetical protein